MSKIDILSMPVAKGLSGAEYFPLVQDGTNVRTQISLLSGVQFNLNTISNAQGAILYRNVKDWVALAPGTPGFVLATAGPAANPSWVENGTGTVSSVGLALPASVFSVSGTPVTSSGTLDGSFVTQIANTVFAGPTSGGDATPAFRSIVNGDIAAAGAALTKTDDTNVTLALGGAPATALVNAASLTFGWTGQLAVARGGTASASFTPYAVLCGGTTSTGALQSVANVGTSGQILTSNGAGALPTFQTAATALGQALTRTDDTNVTLTLGGAPTTALLSATSITAGWTGQLSVARGGTGLASGTSGGILGFTGSTTLASSVALTQHAIALGGGAGATPTPLGSLGTTTTVLHGNAAGAHTFAQVNLTSTVTGILPVPNGGSGIASATAYAVLCGGTTATNPFQSIASVGTMGQVLTSNGPGALPTFQSGAGTGDVVGPASATDNAIALYNGASGKLIKDSSVIVDASNNVSGIASVNTGPLAGFRNHLINGAMMVAQRGTSFTSTTTPANNDDTYLLDRWILLSDGNDIVDVTQATEAPAGGLYSIGLDVETVDKKFGILQIIEQKNCIGLIGNTVTLSAQLKVTNATRLDKIKMAIIAWDGTADTVTSDIISAWNADGTNPTLVANWTYENTPADLGVTTSWARYSVSAAVDTASTKNIGLFIWSDNVTDTDLGDFLYITNGQIEIGSTATPFERRPFGLELEMCRRYAVPVLKGNVGASSGVPWVTEKSTTAVIDTKIAFLPPLFAAPTLLGVQPTYINANPSTGNQVAFFNAAAAAFATITGALTTSLTNASPLGGQVRLTAGTSFSGTNGDVGDVFVGPDVRLLAVAEL